MHGAPEEENEDSYITYVKVPKLGCNECRKLRDLDGENRKFFLLISKKREENILIYLIDNRKVKGGLLCH